MSGIVGHSTYAVLAMRECLKRKLVTAPLAIRHFPSFLAGAYLGSDIQTMPAMICTDDGREAGYGGTLQATCPNQGGPVKPWKLKADGGEYLPSQIHDLFYGRAHLIFGWTKQDVILRVPWDHLPEYFAASIEDATDLYPPSERSLAYMLGWVVHVVSDSLIKSFQPGLSLKLLDGTYTRRNRPIQDLVAFHEIGIRECRLDWSAVLSDLATTPVEPVQLHYMRVGEVRGKLGKLYPQGWVPERKNLLNAVLAENRRWAVQHAKDEIESLQLVRNSNGELEASEALRGTTGLNFNEMMAAAKAAGLREQIDKIASECASMIAAAELRLPRLRSLSTIPF